MAVTVKRAAHNPATSQNGMTLQVAGITPFMETVLDDADAAAARTTLDVYSQAEVDALVALDPELAAIAGLTSAADKLPYFTGSGAAALADITSFARTLIDDSAANVARATLGAAKVSIDTYANRPSSNQNTGDVHFCTDHILHYVWNGTIWAPYYGSVPVKTPLLQDWQDADLTAINEGSAVYADLKDVTQFYWPDNTSGAAQHRVWKKAEPGSTWCVYFGLLLPPDWRDGGGRGVGIYFRNASSGRLLTMYFADDRRKVERWNTATSFNAGMVSVTEDGPHNIAWLALNNDGTNLEFFQAESRFGKWAYIYGETDATFVNACDEVGVGFFGGRQGSQLVPITCTLIHVEEGSAI